MNKFLILSLTLFFTCMNLAFACDEDPNILNFIGEPTLASIICSKGTVYYPNGSFAGSPGRTWYHANGTFAGSAKGSWYHANGAFAGSSKGSWYHANGKYAGRKDGVWYYSDGTYAGRLY